MIPTHILTKDFEAGPQETYPAGTMAQVGSGRVLMITWKSPLPIFDISHFNPLGEYFDKIPVNLKRKIEEVRSR